MTKEKWLLIVLAVILVSAGVYHWVSTSPVWNLYYRDFGTVTSMDELDARIIQIQDDVAQNFGYEMDDITFDIEGNSSIDTTAFRRDVATYLDGSYYEWSVDPITGNYQETRSLGCNVYGFVWLWEDSGVSPNWSMVRQWEDTWREFDYGSPKTKEAQFSMMGATTAPIP